MVALPAFPAVPISISRFRADGLELTIRAAGPATTAHVDLQPGAQVGLRGPLGTAGRSSDAYGRDVVIVAGGIGLAPLRPLIDAHRRRPRPLRATSALLRRAHAGRPPLPRRAGRLVGQRRIDVAVTVDRAGPEWIGPGRRRHPPVRPGDLGRRPKSTAFVCGPERMMQATATSARRPRACPATAST